MITIAKTVLGLSALASAGAWTVIEPAPARMHAPAAPMIAHNQVVNGKIANRLPTVDGKISGEAVMQRIRLAHGMTGAAPEQTLQTLASVDCKAFAWPNIPAECLTSTDGTPVRRATRVISAGSIQPQPTTAPAPVPAQRIQVKFN